MNSILSVLLALALDKLLGEPRRFHPLVGFGNLVKALERLFYADSKLRGAPVLLGGPEVYQGQLQARIVLGEGRAPDAQAIAEAGNLIGRTLLIWIGALFAGPWLIGR
jgi:cobalamin biosynthesis protein CobD/CbiB